ncbi:AAA family ATPase [Metabacillus bambusae]|uniref:Nuclease SbcCD subunit C n=1 Tax=Metabacillus bambusae TaxID=2795218 RepID=A0ABS3N180_9BACI|nr:AAA family ATPase [Metabacillus bambusae]MBO1511688.1 AAA family ATPase [Metabacillus bambusae]
MRPIQLTVSGLHSFREKQIINFDSLCDGGIFGIFGPTGSGKSSILDAMTLALYGKVERAMNNTHGILNHAEDQLTVSFTFELENASAKKQYTVERVFKRTDEIRVKTAICRLIEAGEEKIVLADKAVDVNEQVYGLLGLTIDDFTRAVVLPQGKFAEFLSLKGAERRQMLQRLFHLEQYGDQLMKKLKKRLTSTKIKHNELEAEKTGLGDASSEAVKDAEERLKEAELLLQKRSTELESVTKDFEEKQGIWQLQQQRSDIEKEKIRIEVEEDSIKNLQNQLKEAEEAKELQPYAESLQALKQEKQEAEINLATVKKQFVEIKEQYETISLSYEEIRKNKADHEPRLVAKREKLLQLQKVEEDVKRDQKLLSEFQHKKLELQEQRAKSNALLTKAQQFVEKAMAKQQVLKEEQKTKTITAKEREHVREALEAKHKVKQSQQILLETKELVNNKLTAIDQEKQKLNLITEKVTNSKTKLQEQFVSLNQLYFLVSEREREHATYVHSVKEQFDVLLAKEEKAKSQKLAQELVKQLNDGKPCPVCGSISHPSPVHLDEVNPAEVEKQSDLIREHLDRLQSLSQESHSIKIKLESLSQQVVSDFPFLLELKQIDETKIDRVITIDQELTYEQGYSRFHAEFKEITQDYLQIKNTLDKLMKQVREQQQEEIRRTDFISSATQDANEWSRKQQEYQQKYDQELSSYSERFSSMPLDKIEQLQKEIVEKDEAFEQLNERIQKSISFIEEQEEMVKEQERKNQQLTEQEIELLAEIKNRGQLIAEKQEKLKEVDQNQQISQQIEETETQLKQLIERENELYQSWQQKSNQLHQLQSQLVAIEKSYDQTNLKLAEAEQKWITASEETSFKTIEETLAAVLPADRKQQMKAKIEFYMDKIKQLYTDLHRIEEKLSGKQLTLAEWEQIQQIKVEVKDQVDEAVASKGAANNTLQMLIEKHERFMVIENEQKELDAMLQKLEKLQSVFKGNTFVEYVAEEQLEQVSRDASERLRQLTRGRYAIEVDSQGGFIMRDDANGGVRRPVSTLSGGETFLTSLALALSLSTQIQLRGEYPLQFFFLDEGFGTLDVDLLDTVVTALEKLQAQNLSVGVISHVGELRARLPRKLIVEPAEPSGKGSTVYLESL